MEKLTVGCLFCHTFIRVWRGGGGELATVFGCAARAKKKGRGERDSATKLGDDLAAVTVGGPKRKRRRSVNFSPPWRRTRKEVKKCFGTFPPFYVFCPFRNSLPQDTSSRAHI